MAYFVLVVFIFAMAVLFYTLSMFDRLVQAEYEGDREAWEMDGRPCGFFWKAPECTWFRSEWARICLGFVWVFTTPAWAEHSVMGRTWLKRLRIGTLVWNVIMLFYFIWLVAFVR